MKSSYQEYNKKKKSSSTSLNDFVLGLTGFPFDAGYNVLAGTERIYYVITRRRFSPLGGSNDFTLG